MTKVQGWIVIGMLGFLCFNMLVADFVAIRFITGVGSAVSEVSEDFPTDMFSDMPTPTDFPSNLPSQTECVPDNVTCF